MDVTDWSGVYTALVTPFSEDGGRVDEARLIEQIEFQASPLDGPGATGVVAIGTTGESPTLTDSEQKRVIEVAIEHGRRLGLRVIAGTGSNDTARACAMQRFAADAGADATLSVTPYYNKPNQRGMEQHFRAVADAADIPVILYNIPGRCGAGLTAETIVKLADHPNIVAVKEASGTVEIADAVMGSGAGLAVLSGDDALTLPMMVLGATGVVSVVSNVLPERMRRMVDAALAGDFTGALAEHRQLAGLSRALLTLEPNPVGVKAAMRFLGRDSGVVRPPLKSASVRSLALISRLVERAGAWRAPFRAYAAGR